MSNCCGETDTDAKPCPDCGHVGPVVGTAPVRPHLPDAVDGEWQHCANEQCRVIYHLGADTIDADFVITQVGLKATDKPTPVCFCFAHTADALGVDLAANNGVSEIKASIKNAVAGNQCACEHLNPIGKCCLADVHRTLKSFAAAANLFCDADHLNNWIQTHPAAGDELDLATTATLGREMWAMHGRADRDIE